MHHDEDGQRVGGQGEREALRWSRPGEGGHEIQDAHDQKPERGLPKKIEMLADPNGPGIMVVTTFGDGSTAMRWLR